ncbi:DUF2742 domain-containing protein, partial [Mycobacterium intracellulare]
CELGDGDPRKLLALAIDGEHHVLRKETGQAAMAEVSHAIAAAADWSALSRQIRSRAELYAARPWLRRAVQ